MTNSSLKLWSFQFSPFAGKVRAALSEKGVDYEILEINPRERPTRLRELNHFNRVPVLEVDGAVLTESAIICDWIEETYPDPALWPEDPAARAEARATAYWVDEQVTKVFFAGMIKKSRGLAEGDPADIVEQLQAKIVRRWPMIEAMLAKHGGPWIAGNEFTYADLGAMPDAVRIPQWVPELAPDPAETPLVAAWFEALRSRPSAAAIEAKGAEVVADDQS